MSDVRGTFEEHVNRFDISSSAPEIYPEECNTAVLQLVLQVWVVNISEILNASSLRKVNFL